MRYHVRHVTAAMIVLLLTALPAAADQGTVTTAGAATLLKETLDSILTVLLDPQLKQQDTAGRMDTVQKLFRQRFAEPTFCKRALGKHWDGLTDEKRTEFVTLFSDLLVTTYLERIDGYLTGNPAFTKNDIIYLGERTTPKYTLVKTDVKVDQATTIPVLYRMEQINDTWMVTDIAIEGISLLKNYRAQFNEIIANAGYEDLIKRLKDKKV